MNEEQLLACHKMLNESRSYLLFGISEEGGEPFVLGAYQDPADQIAILHYISKRIEDMIYEMENPEEEYEEEWEDEDD